MSQVNTFSDFGIKPKTKNRLEGEKVDIDTILNIEITVEKFSVEDTRLERKDAMQYDKCLWMQIILNGVRRVVFKGSKNLVEMIQQVPEDKFPFQTRIIKTSKHAPYEFK